MFLSTALKLQLSPAVTNVPTQDNSVFLSTLDSPLPNWLCTFPVPSALGLQQQKSCSASGTSTKEVPEPAKEESGIKNESEKG